MSDVLELEIPTCCSNGFLFPRNLRSSFLESITTRLVELTGSSCFFRFLRDNNPFYSLF